MTKEEQIIMLMITHAGMAKSAAFEAMRLARNSKYSKAKETIEAGKKESIEANKAHFSMLSGEEKQKFSILLIHAEDQMITSQLVLELAEEFIEMYKVINSK